MRWQGPARMAVAALGAGFVVVLVVMSRERDPVPAPPAATRPADPEATSESDRGTTIRRRGAEDEWLIAFERSTTYPDGRVRFEQAHATFGRTGQELWADVVETAGRAINADEPSRYELTGGVRFREAGRLSVETDRATYDDQTGILTMPDAVTFTQGAVSGSGRDGTYDRTRELFRLAAEAEIEVAPSEEAPGGLRATADAMSVSRSQHYLRLSGDARLERERETLTADVLTVSFLDETSQVRFLELRGHARVTPTGEGTGAAPSMAASDITLAFYPDNATLQHATLYGGARLGLAAEGGRRDVAANRLDLSLGRDGTTITGLDGQDQVVVTLGAAPPAPSRIIRASSMVSEGTEAAGLQSARFEGGVEYVEGGPADGDRRTATSQTLVLTLGGSLEQIEDAEFRRRVVFADGEVRATAPVGRYHAGRGELRLRREADGGAVPHVETGGVTVDGHEIDLTLESEDLEARGSVGTVSVSGEGDAAASGQLFTGDAPVYGSAESFTYRGETGAMTYRGTAGLPARLVQGRDRVSAGLIGLDADGETLEASGGVETRFVVAEGGMSGGSGNPAAYVITGDRFTYVGADGLMTYDGEPVTMLNPDGETISSRLVVRLADADRRIEGFDATTAVYVALEGGDELKGDRLVYVAATRTYTLDGAPAQVKSPDDEGTACTLVTGRHAVFTVGMAARWSWPPGEPPRGALSRTETIRCSVSIR